MCIAERQARRHRPRAEHGISLVEQVQLQPFTYCDPDDPNAATALNTAGCTAGGAEAIGPELSAPYGPETRTGGTTPFDNVNDYHNYSMSGITDITGTAITGLENYTASVTVANPLANPLGTIPATDSLLITVTVNGPPGTNTTVVLDGYRVRYAPNALP